MTQAFGAWPIPAKVTMKRETNRHSWGEPRLAVEACAASGAAVCRHTGAVGMPEVADAGVRCCNLDPWGKYAPGAGDVAAARGYAGWCRNRRNHHGKPHVLDGKSSLSALAHCTDPHAGGHDACICGDTSGPTKERRIGHGRGAARTERIASGGKSGSGGANFDISRAMVAGGLALDSVISSFEWRTICAGARGPG